MLLQGKFQLLFKFKNAIKKQGLRGVIPGKAKKYSNNTKNAQIWL